MEAGRHSWRREGGVATLEFVGLALAAVVLLGAVAIGMAREGGDLGEAVGTRIEAAVGGEVVASGEPVVGREQVVLPFEGRRRVVREKRWSGGSEPQRVSRDELRMSPVVDPIAAWQRRWMRQGRVGGVDLRIDTRACALCTALEWSHEHGSGASVDPDGTHVGLEGSLLGSARVAIAAVDATIRARRRLGPADLTGQARVRGIVGTEAEGEARLRLSRTAQDVQLHGSAMAGAAAKAEGRVGVDLLGIAIRQGGRAEGWAGAGARGTVGVRREGPRMEWRLGWGSALGLGGAGEWSGSVDVSGVPVRHRKLARRSLVAAIRAGLFPPLVPLSFHH